MTRRLVRAALAIVPFLPHVASAQGPWAPSLTVGRKALGTGECSAVSLTLIDAKTKEWPRGPNGSRVSLADFDLTVSAPVEHAAVGQYDGPTSFAVCACPRAPAGTVATVTATYPSKFIAPKARASEVSFATSTTVPIVASASSGSAPGCDPPTPTTAIAGGRALWTVTVTPPAALSIGSCGAVQLTLRDSTGKDWPRTPLGARVSLADFDLTATTANGADVVGKLDGASSFSACACQSGTVGEAATVTATYPARALAAKAQVPGVALQASAPFTLTAARGSANPSGCGDKSSQPQVAMAGPLNTATLQTQVVAPPVMTAEPSGPAAPAASMPARGVTPVVAPPLAPGSSTIKSPITTAPAPANVAITGTPLVAHLSWSAAPNAVRYAVWRASGQAPFVERTTASFTALQFADAVPDPHESYRYSVIAYYADGTSGEAPAVRFTSPPLANPTGFVAADRGGGGVDWTWQPVAGAMRYRLDGTGLPATGYFTNNTQTAYPHIPAGTGHWKVSTVYPGNFVDTASGTPASLVVHVLPARSMKWLTKNNGAGSLAQVQVPANPFDPKHPCSPLSTHQPTLNDCTQYDVDNHTVNQGVYPGDLSTAPYDPQSLGWLTQTPVDDWATTGFKRWLDVALPLWSDQLQAANEAVYGNPLDLGVGRRAACAQEMKGPPYPGLKTVCYATAHGATPGTPGFNDSIAITHPAAGIGGDFILAMVIVRDFTGTTFLVLGRGGTLLPTVKLDTEGPKIVPFACISCHGGTYNASTRKVDDSSLLPLDPGLLSFASAADKAAQQEKIRKINFKIAMAQPSSAISAYLNGLYNGAIGSPGTVAQADYVPSGWSQQAGFYRSVVRPHCAMCHLAAPPSWNFASWGNFEQNKALIHADVCNAHTMPHAEVPFKSFWLKDTGILYLPGLLAAQLGFPSC